MAFTSWCQSWRSLPKSVLIFTKLAFTLPICALIHHFLSGILVKCYFQFLVFLLWLFLFSFQQLLQIRQYHARCDFEQNTLHTLACGIAYKEPRISGLHETCTRVTPTVSFCVGKKQYHEKGTQTHSGVYRHNLSKDWFDSCYRTEWLGCHIGHRWLHLVPIM